MNPTTFSMAVALFSTLTLAACSNFPTGDPLGWGQCGEYAEEYSAALAQSGALLDAVPATGEGYAMAMVLNQDAINNLFSRLSDVDLPELGESTTVLGQQLGVSVRPALPLLQVGGDGACADCIQANVPFDVGLDLAGLDLPRGAGNFTVQMPLGLMPEGDHQTALVARFQSIELLSLDLNLTGAAADVFEFVEPLVNQALTAFLQSRFEDARIATIDSWEIGRGEVLLAARGPFVNHQYGTITLAMQSNLPLPGGARAQARAQLPEGADIGIVIHPGLLAGMGGRMLYEGHIPQEYDARGEPRVGGSTRFTLSSIGSDDNGLLRATSTLWQTGGPCGTADLSASVAFSAGPGGVSFALDDLEVTGGRGAGSILQSADQLAGHYLDELLETVQVTVNYDAFTGGEAGSTADLETFQFNVDGRGLTLYLDVLD